MTSLKVLLSLLFLATYGEAQGCVWTKLLDNCNDARCPPDTVEVTRGADGTCPDPSHAGVCLKGMKKLCCPRDIQLKNCEWSGWGPFCGRNAICARGKTELARDGWGDGLPCLTGCKKFCCEVLS